MMRPFHCLVERIDPQGRKNDLVIIGQIIMPESSDEFASQLVKIICHTHFLPCQKLSHI
jgi:hypothetical protein